MQKIEGIILKTSSFEDTAHILHVLSKEFGILSLVTKNYASKTMRSYSPLLKIEACVIHSHKELWKCKEISIIATYTGLRLNLEKLQLAASLIKIVHQMLPQKVPVELIYTLLDAHLSSLSSGKATYAIASSFLLKLFHLEGVLSPTYTNSLDELKTLESLLIASVEELDTIHCSAELYKKIRNR